MNETPEKSVEIYKKLAPNEIFKIEDKESIFAVSGINDKGIMIEMLVDLGEMIDEYKSEYFEWNEIENENWAKPIVITTRISALEHLINLFPEYSL